jgi:uncharacterized protein YjbJ (UPF0337 family)
LSKLEKLFGRFKKAAGDAIDDPSLRREGVKQERKAEAREEAALAEERAEEKAREVADLERRTS